MRAIQCILGHARAVIPSSAAKQVAFVEVTGPVPLAKQHVVGTGFFADAPLIVMGFAVPPEGCHPRRVVLLDDGRGRLMRLGLQIDAVEALTELAEVEEPLASSGALSFFRRGTDAMGQTLRVLDVAALFRYALGPT